VTNANHTGRVLEDLDETHLMVTLTWDKQFCKMVCWHFR